MQAYQIKILNWYEKVNSEREGLCCTVGIEEHEKVGGGGCCLFAKLRQFMDYNERKGDIYGESIEKVPRQSDTNKSCFNGKPGHS